jgi:hypothetical protein
MDQWRVRKNKTAREDGPARKGKASQVVSLNIGGKY